MRKDKIVKQVVTAERLFALSVGCLPPSAVHLDESLLIPAEERLAWERKLNRYLNSCGCAEGAAGLFLGLTSVFMIYLAQSKPWPGWEIASAVALPLVLLVGGKTLGLWLDRLRFRKVSKLLLARLSFSHQKGNHHE